LRVLPVGLVWSSLVWILLRLVVAVRLILPLSTASGLASPPIGHGLLSLSWSATLALVLARHEFALVVIPVVTSLVLAVLLLILIPASASGCPLISTLSEATTVIVASSSLVTTLTPAIPILVVLDSLRVLIYHS